MTLIFYADIWSPCMSACVCTVCVFVSMLPQEIAHPVIEVSDLLVFLYVCHDANSSLSGVYREMVIEIKKSVEMRV